MKIALYLGAVISAAIILCGCTNQNNSATTSGKPGSAENAVTFGSGGGGVAPCRPAEFRSKTNPRSVFGRGTRRRDQGIAAKARRLRVAFPVRIIPGLLGMVSDLDDGLHYPLPALKT